MQIKATVHIFKRMFAYFIKTSSVAGLYTLITNKRIETPIYDISNGILYTGKSNIQTSLFKVQHCFEIVSTSMFFFVCLSISITYWYLFYKNINKEIFLWRP